MPVKDPVRKRAINKRYRERHKEEIRDKAKDYRKQNREQIRQINREYYYNNTEKVKLKQTEWRSTNPDKYKEQIQRRIYFKGRYITLDKNPRKGKCQDCEKIGYTNLHHTYYHDDDPLKDTIELCVSCHRKRHLNDKKKGNDNS